MILKISNGKNMYATMVPFPAIFQRKYIPQPQNPRPHRYVHSHMLKKKYVEIKILGWKSENIYIIVIFP